jgi:hypothetical protein
MLQFRGSLVTSDADLPTPGANVVPWLFAKRICVASFSRECEVTHTRSRFPSLRSGSSTCRQEAKMAQDLGIILAMATIVIVIMTWAAPPNPKSVSAETVPPSEVIYRPQHFNLY